MNFFVYIRKLINKNNNESSKVFIALSVTILVFYVTIRFANKDNAEVILGELLSFILVLTGVSIWEKTKK